MIVKAQIDGLVRDTYGTPLPDIEVQLLGQTSVLATSVTNGDGVFSFTPQRNADAIRASGMGFSSVTVTIDNLLRPVEITLHPEPIELPSVTAVTSEIPCGEDERRAHELWSQMTSQYQVPDSSTQWGAAIVEIRKGTTWLEDFGNVGPSQFTWAVTGGGGRYSAWNASRIRRVGFARAVNMGSLDGREEAWEYPTLDGPHALLFLTDAFVEQHTLTVQEENGDVVVLDFCPSGASSRPGISGRLILTVDLKVERAEWKFHTPAPIEEAGGQATFNVEAEYLLPEEGVFWRKTSFGKYFQEARRYSEWFVGSQSEVEESLRSIHRSPPSP